MQNGLNTTLLSLNCGSCRDVLVRGEALCKEKLVYYIILSASVTETSFWKFLDNTNLDKHTHTHTQTLSLSLSLSLLYTSDQPVAQTANCTTHNKTQQINTLAISGIRTCECRNEVAATYALDCMTNGIVWYIII